jgi:uncharacterized protein (DUF488 family)
VNVFTIGVYGASEAAFFSALLKAEVDTFCDIRWRRGVRGKEYAFVNSNRLQKRLQELGIRYVHFRELAPPHALRQRQYQADKAQDITKRQRVGLDEAFLKGYQREVLAGFDTAAFVEKLGANARNIVLFCVERAPEACHRSILAQRLERDLGLRVSHLFPEASV